MYSYVIRIALDKNKYPGDVEWNVRRWNNKMVVDLLLKQENIV